MPGVGEGLHDTLSLHPCPLVVRDSVFMFSSPGYMLPPIPSMDIRYTFRW